MSWGSASHHLRVLARRGELRTVDEGREVRLFPPGVSQQHMRWLGVLHDGVNQSILRDLERHPGAGIKDLSQSLQASRRVIGRHLAVLSDEGLVSAEGRRDRRYHIGEGLETGMDELLAGRR